MTLLRVRWIRALLAGLLPAMWALLAPAAAAQSAAANFPNKPIKIIVPFTPGGTTDVIARTIGQKLTEAWGQQVVVENRPGAAGWLGITQMAKMPADGHTFAVTISNIIYAHALYAKLPFDIQKDFEPISMLSRSAVALAVLPDFPANTLDQFIALVRANPKKYHCASFGQGTSAHIFCETMNLQNKIDLVHVPYKGAAPMVTDLLGGQISAAILDTGTLRPLWQAGKVKVLAMTGPQRVAAMASVPTYAELGHKGYEPVGFFLALAPAGTPKEITRKISDAIAQAIRSADFQAKLLEFGQEPEGGTPEHLGNAIKVYGDIFDRAIKAAGIKVDQP